MINSRSSYASVFAFAVILLSGCTIVRPLQISPFAKPEIVIYHHIQLQTAPVVYIIMLAEEAAGAWKALDGKNKISLKPGVDFQVFHGRLTKDEIHAYRDVDLKVSGQIELDSDEVHIDLSIIPSSSATTHPIDGTYRFTDKKPLTVVFNNFYMDTKSNSMSIEESGAAVSQ